MKIFKNSIEATHNGRIRILKANAQTKGSKQNFPPSKPGVSGSSGLLTISE